MSEISNDCKIECLTTLSTHLGSERAQKKIMNLTLWIEQRYVIKHYAKTRITPIDMLKFMERDSAKCFRRLVIKWH